MTNNPKINSIVTFIGKPVLIGLFVAAVLMLVFPEFRGHSNNTDNKASMDLRDSRCKSNENHGCPWKSIGFHVNQLITGGSAC